MTILYVATSNNRLKAIEVENKTGEFVRLVQDIDPIVEPALVTSNVETNDLKPASDGGVRSENTTNVNDKDGILGFLGSYTRSLTATTEWIERHPTFDSLLYVFTSFWNKTSAIVTTYRILGLDNQDIDCLNKEKGPLSDKRSLGRLKKLGSVQTKGLHVSHVTFSPDHFGFVQKNSDNPKHKRTTSTMCVGHYMDGSLSFFDCSRDTALGEPIRVVALPEVRPETRNTTYPNPLPSVHHVTYNPCPIDMSFRNADNGDGDDGNEELCKYLLVSDTSKQGRVWTYAVDSIGLPISDQPVSFRKVTYISPPPGWLTRILTGDWVAGLADYRIRRCVVHPHGRYVYMMLEFNAVIHVYEINPFTGRIAGDCLQEIPTINPDCFGWKKTIGPAVHASAELYATANEVFVSNRGFNFWGGAAESGVRIFSIENNGAKLVPKQALECEGPVRHFLTSDLRRRCSETSATPSDDHFSSSPSIIFVGSDKRRAQNGNKINGNSNASIETFIRRDPEAVGGTFERVGFADVGMDDITCIAMLE